MQSGLYGAVQVCTGENRCVLDFFGLYSCELAKKGIYRLVLGCKDVFW